MAWTVQNIQNQVQQHTNRSGIDSKVLTWINRVLQEISVRAFWTRNVNEFSISGFTTATTTLASNWVSVTQAATLNLIAIYQAHYSTTNAMVRLEPQDLMARMQGQVRSSYTGDFEYYAVPRWISYTNTTTEEYFVPYVAALPIPAATTAPLTLNALCAPNKMTAASDTHWILKKYPLLVLSGVMRYAALYVGDLAGYLAAKGRFENGFRDMLLNEETSLVGAPALRGVIPEVMQRGGA